MQLSPAIDRWIVPERDASAEAQLISELGVPSLLAAVLVRRGLREPAEADDFLNPSLDDLSPPDLLPDYAAAREALLGARERNELVFVHGDYDVDGVTSATIFARFLGKVGFQVKAHVPHRLREGYGIHLSAVQDASDSGAKLFLTCDCGGSAHEQVERANELGLRVVVTDHHEVGETLPAAEAVVNPHRRDSAYPFAELSGAGVAFRLCEGLARELGHDVSQFRRAYLDLAALGTIADVMPLVGENRILAKFGLQALGVTKKAGLIALKRIAELHGAVTAYHVGFVLGPRLNAAGRIDDAALALQLLLENDGTAAAELAIRIEDINTRRREEQERTVLDAIERVESEGLGEAPVIVLAASGWHPGVIGIVAGRLVERFSRPAFVFTIEPETGVHKGSGRSIPKFHLADALNAHRSLILSGGGHQMAAGCTVTAEAFPALREALVAYAGELLSPEDLRPMSEADAVLEPGEATLEAVETLRLLEPFGVANPEPTFVAREVRLVAIKPTKNPKVAQLSLRQGDGPTTGGVAFEGEALMEEKPAMCDLLFKARIDEFRGASSVKWHVRDFEPV
ncbi:MAG: single-stranded-DNA-specific exonuclease RecJ [Fimbriimonas ginsengisoli]|uniref:Single-stranded-DNA-specific exonuclease RecJ n=1 Tax=Fimbriimonas ginsengisoli TaxID=1005039 RepID=A0A931LTX2_FIMGI|nr:single-stranded-DNA-specific exonuclease RecJ [Fimbriimonas ginsengisoli]